MSTSYDSSLPTDKDRVRFLVRDTSDPFRFQDEEIQYYIDLEVSKGTKACCIQYEVAILLLSAMLLDFAQSGSSSGFDDLKRYETPDGGEVELGRGAWTKQSITDAIAEYKLLAARCVSGRSSRYFKAIGTAPYVNHTMPVTE